MMKIKPLFYFSLFLLFSCANNKVKKETIVPATENVVVSYEKDIKPIVSKNCLECHFDGSTLAPHNWANASEFKEYALKSSDFLGYTVLQARIYGKLERMPLGKDALPEEQLKLIDTWISQGAAINN